MVVAATKNPKGHEPGHSGDEPKKKSILIYSPDVIFCFSLSALFQNRYNVSTTTIMSMVETFVANCSADLVIIDAVPSARMIERIESMREGGKHIPIIMLYVYSGKDVQLDEKVRKHVDAIFYKPFEIDVVSKRIEELLPA
jgi:DNA-binding response OmpR family regulator